MSASPAYLGIGVGGTGRQARGHQPPRATCHRHLSTSQAGCYARGARSGERTVLIP